MVHATPETFEDKAITGHFGFIFEENSARENHITSSQLCFHTRTHSRRFQIALSKSPVGIGNVLAWEGGLTI